jgi:type III pantothenate kinase
VRGSESPPRWLLIGNSRWHWAWPDPTAPGGLAIRHTAPEPPDPDPTALLAWAAVGPVPAGRLPLDRRLALEAVPLGDLPPWLGIDRALGGWLAWRRVGGSVLLADAGTVLSLTWVDGGGRFRGGRLLAGAALQLRAMAAGTAALPDLGEAGWGGDDPALAQPPSPWPRATDGAMRAGVLRGLAAAIAAAHRELREQDPGCRLVLTGGDAAVLAALPAWGADPAATPQLQPDLGVAALAALRPESV